MGVCHSKKTQQQTNQPQDLTISNQQSLLPIISKLDDIVIIEKTPENDSQQSEVDLLATDELLNNPQLAAIDQLHREQVKRHVHAQQHHQDKLKRYVVVFDKLYKQERKVPILISLNESTLLRRRRSGPCS
ncbi:unnamed protein product (macronuclear) [Paramecium tetraurelia]|uniref:Uncharacterized protein n=1 Tax=Paramecium tetraurelia TaxID=5888 RepID=A0CBC1_PARTE|nr:uncharacterized protein GSPATT00036871001 [Paramecium tetraurelia]CAK68088.1 unnamed protein product [Paramecium tetraurelia]|eukprot:XP_001435485.1 hypothetical protein (macronuclear) [Paramecium tetraurelia strain d4-2]